MRIAALYDIHGNLDALEAVLADVEAANPDLILLGGDVVMGPFPAQTLDLLLALKRPVECIRGNTDRELIVAPAPREVDPWRERRQWVARQLTPRHRAWLAGLPTTAAFDVTGLGPTLFCHGTPRSDEEIITRITHEDRLHEVLDCATQGVIVCGHVHVQYDRRAAGKRIVNAGSVGFPFEREPGAYWAMLGPDVELRHTAYDVARAVDRIKASPFPDAAEFVEKALLSPLSPDQASEQFERMATGAHA